MKDFTNNLPLLYRDRWNNEWLVDTETGEMIQKGRTKKQPKYSNLYYGLDTKRIEECNTKEQLLEVASMLDAYTDNKVYVNDTFLTESVIEGLIVPSQLKLLRHIARNVCVWNIYLGSRDDLLQSGVDSKSLKRTLRSLDSLIRVESVDIPYKGDYKILINPHIAWKGDYKRLEWYKNRWYGIAESEGVDV